MQFPRTLLLLAILLCLLAGSGAAQNPKPNPDEGYIPAVAPEDKKKKKGDEAETAQPAAVATVEPLVARPEPAAKPASVSSVSAFAPGQGPCLDDYVPPDNTSTVRGGFYNVCGFPDVFFDGLYPSCGSTNNCATPPSPRSMPAASTPCSRSACSIAWWRSRTCRCDPFDRSQGNGARSGPVSFAGPRASRPTSSLAT